MFFGPTARQLFGVYHQAQGGPRDHAVVISIPVGHDNARTHRVGRQLATSLSRSGLHAFRFDYTGVGDSFGSMEDADLDVWHEDLETAARELMDLSGSRTLSLVGLRLGATIVGTASEMRAPVDSVVLWDPVVEGRAFLERTTLAHHKSLRLRHSNAAPTELLGYPVSESFRRQLQDLGPDAFRTDPAHPLVLAESRERPEVAALVAHLEEQGTPVERHTVSDPYEWDFPQDFGIAIAAPTMIDFIVRLLVDR